MQSTHSRNKTPRRMKQALCLAATLWTFALSAPCPADTQVSPPQATIEPADVFPGDVLLVSVTTALHPITAGTCIWQKQHVPLHTSDNGSSAFAFLAVPADEPPGAAMVRITATARDSTPLTARAAFTILAKEFPLQCLTLPESQVTLSKKNLARHRREKKQIDTVLGGLRPEKLWRNRFQAPVPGTLISPFGVRRRINGKPRSSHSGVDLRAKTGEPVHACSDGLVILTGSHFFAGNSVYVDHGMGIVSMYFHLSQISVTPGDHVAAGQIVGLAGSTGRSTGSHLHWGVRVNGCTVNPLSLIAVSALAP